MRESRTAATWSTMVSRREARAVARSESRREAIRRDLCASWRERIEDSWSAIVALTSASSCAESWAGEGATRPLAREGAGVEEEVDWAGGAVFCFPFPFLAWEEETVAADGDCWSGTRAALEVRGEVEVGADARSGERDWVGGGAGSGVGRETAGLEITEVEETWGGTGAGGEETIGRAGREGDAANLAE